MWAQHILGRPWRKVSPVGNPWKHYNKMFEFSILSYNILSQLLLEQNKYLYRSLSEEHLKANRIYKIMHELDQYDSDIVCLQEFDHQNNDIFKSHFFHKGFSSIYQRKPQLPYTTKDDGCFIMYKADKFKLLHNASVGLYKDGEQFLDKPNCAQIALFECADGSQVCIANTHLLYNPKRGDIKLAQLSLILHHIQQLVNPQQECGGVPVVFCGDFNSCPSSPLYNLMKYGKLQYSEYTSDKISGQKAFQKKYRIQPGLWNHHTQGYHEHGLMHRSESELMDRRETHRSLSQDLSLLSSEYTKLSDCSKCLDLYPYKQGSITHNNFFRSAYDHMDDDGRTKEITTYIQYDARTVDYIWYSNHDNTPRNCAHGHTCNKSCSSSVMLLRARRRLLTKRELNEMGKPPNNLLGSDHQALQAMFTLYSDPVPNSSGSIKLCKDIEQLYDSGWQDPTYTQQLSTVSKLETDVIIGLNCVAVKSMVNNIPAYICNLCNVEFHHNDRNHIIGRHHRINVIWNWEKATADRISKGLDFPKPFTRAKAQAELEDVTQKIFKLEQDLLNEKQYDLYLVMSSKKLPSELGKDMKPRPSGDRESIEDHTKKARKSNEHVSPQPVTSSQSHVTPTSPDVSSPQPTKPPPPPPPIKDPLKPEIRAEFELFSLMNELEESGNFHPPARPSDPTKLLNLLYTLGEGLLEYQTKTRELPMELPRDQIKGITKVLGTLRGLLESLKRRRRRQRRRNRRRRRMGRAPARRHHEGYSVTGVITTILKSANFVFIILYEWIVFKLKIQSKLFNQINYLNWMNECSCYMFIFFKKMACSLTYNNKLS